MVLNPYLSFVFVLFSLLDLVAELELYWNWRFPACKFCLFIFYFIMSANPCKPKGYSYISLLLKTYAELYIISFPYAFILFLFLALPTKRPRFYHQIVNNFSIFYNLFQTISPLSGKILITCLRNSKACLSSFS